jgi:serine-protein kinase ATM
MALQGTCNVSHSCNSRRFAVTDEFSPRYHPNDLKSGEIFNRMKGVQEAHCREPDKQLSFFLEVRKEFRPVMGHYFTEIHKTPISWFSMRLNYTRSVATTSIVGHVLGIGDRHVSNILLDNITGEIIHIDFGIAFDQVILFLFGSIY